MRCRDVILGGAISQLPNDTFVRLQERDRKLFAAARRDGHTHLRTGRPAKRVASAGANTYAASGGNRGWESISLTPDSPAPPLLNQEGNVTHNPNVTYNVSLLLPNKRLRVKSTLTPGMPLKRLKVKTTLPCTVLPTVG